MRSHTFARGLAVLLLSLTATCAALAEPPAYVPYVNRSTGECALYITSSERVQRTPLDPAFLGAECAPLIWIHLALLIVVLASLGALAYVILERRGKRRRAMATAGEDTLAPPEAPT